MAKYQGIITEQQFFDWNPVLNGSCTGMWLGYYYCVLALEEGTYPPPATVTPVPTAVQPGIIGGCLGYYMATPGDTCESIVNIFGTFTNASFLGWNPAVLSDCSGLTVCGPSCE